MASSQPAAGSGARWGSCASVRNCGSALTPCCTLLPALVPACLPCLQLKELKVELGGLRVAKVTGGAPNKLSKM